MSVAALRDDSLLLFDGFGQTSSDKPVTKDTPMYIGSHGIISTAADMLLWVRTCLNSFDNRSSKLDIAIYETLRPIIEGEMQGFGWSNEGEAHLVQIVRQELVLFSEGTELPQRAEPYALSFFCSKTKFILHIPAHLWYNIITDGSVV